MVLPRVSLAVFVAAVSLELAACDDDAVSPGGGTPTTAWEAMESGTDNDIHAVWAASASDVFAVGASGTILRFDGSSWQPMNSGTTDNLMGVWGTAGDSVIATSDLGGILVFDGSDWVATPGVTTDPIGRIAGIDASRVVAAGGGPPGSFVQFDGVNWIVRSTGGSQTITDVAAASSGGHDSYWLVGEGGVAFIATPDTLVAVVEVPTGTTSDLRAAFLTSGTVDAFAVGDDGTVLAFNLNAFPVEVNTIPSPSANFTGIASRGYNDLFLCAADGSVFGFDRCATQPSRGSGGTLFDVAPVSDTRVMAVGADGTILSYSKPAPPICPDNVSVSISGGTTPTFSWSPNCPVTLVLVEEQAGDMWLVESDGNLIASGVRYGAHHSCETGFWYDGPLLPGVEYDLILFRYDEDVDDYTLIALETFTP